MAKRLRLLVPIVLLAALAGGGYWWYRSGGSLPFVASAAASDALTGSGTIEVEEVLVTSEVGGRVKDLPVDEGQEVRKGSVLVALDTALLDAQLAQARASVQAAEANLALLKAGSRSEEIAQAQAQLDQAQATREGAAQALDHAKANTMVTQAQVQASGAGRTYQDALTTLKNPQELQTQVVAAQTARDAAAAAATQARINTQATRDRLSLAKTQAESQMQQATDALTQAQARYAQAKSNWEYVQSTGKDPIQPNVTNQSTGKKQDNKVSDGARENYYNALVQAEAAMHQSEKTVTVAQAGFDTARQAEVTGIQTADEQVKAAEVAQANAEANLAHVQSITVNPQQLRAAADAALAQLNTAKAGVEGARVQYQAGVDTAQTQLASADAAVNRAQAQLELAQAGARVEQLRQGEAQVAQAQASLKQLEVQRGKATLTAPRDGVILTRSIHEGEQAVPGATLMTLGSLNVVKLTVFVPENQIGLVHLGQRVAVRVDSFPGRTFNGSVTLIPAQAEFTPRNVQTKEERVTTVFGVRVELPNADHALKPGMAADATFVK